MSPAKELKIYCKFGALNSGYDLETDTSLNVQNHKPKNLIYEMAQNVYQQKHCLTFLFVIFTFWLIHYWYIHRNSQTSAYVQESVGCNCNEVGTRIEIQDSLPCKCKCSCRDKVIKYGYLRPWIQDLNEVERVKRLHHHPNLTGNTPIYIKGLTQIDVTAEGLEAFLEAHPPLRDSVLNHPELLRCKSNTVMNVNYRICTHGSKGAIYKAKNWENGIIQLEHQALQAAGANAVFLDVGANIGTHSLFHTATGRTVVAIEAMPGNALDIVLAYLAQNPGGMNTIPKSMAVFQGALSEKVGILVARQDGDNGHYALRPMEEFENKIQFIDPTQSISSSTMVDVLTAMPGNSTIVIKVDIEGGECAVFPDRRIFNETSHFIPYVFIGFHYGNNGPGTGNAGNTGGPSENLCNRTKLDNLLKNFHDHNYTFYAHNGQLINFTEQDIASLNGLDGVFVNDKAKPLKFD